MSELEEALGEVPKKEPAPTPPAAVEPEPVAAAEPAEAEAPEPEKEPAPVVPLAALHEERAKRQELDRRLAMLEQRSKPAPEPAPDVFTDPEGYTKHMEKQATAAAQTARLDLSEDMARMHYGDKAVEAALAAIEPFAGTPQHQQILNSRNPYRELVEWHKKQRVAAEIGDPDAWRQQEREKIKAELEAEMAVKQTREPAPSLAAQPNLGARKGPEWSGPTPLEKILGG